MTITEMLARNDRLYPDSPALIEITPSKNLRMGHYLEGI